MGKIADRIKVVRARQFVGRALEKAQFADFVSRDKPCCVLFVYGPGGIGKTSLLHEFERISESRGKRYVALDGRNLQANPAAFLGALVIATNQSSPEAACAALEDSILFVDTYEAIQELDPWMRESFIPDLPDTTLVVIFGRSKPSAAWQQDVWLPMCRTIALSNLGLADARTLLESREIPEEEQERIFRITHGYPLALALAAENYAQGDRTNLSDVAQPDVVRILLDRFLGGVDDPVTRDALELFALARVTTEGLLAEVIDKDRASELFSWLKSLSFVESSVQGLAPHDLARDIILAELRWRNPDRHSQLHHRARAYYSDHLERAAGLAQQLILLDYIYLHRENPVVGPSFLWNSNPGAFADRPKLSDLAEIAAMVEKFEGPVSASLVKDLFRNDPEMFQVFRRDRDRLAGFLARIELTKTPQSLIERDPALRAGKTYLDAHAPLRAGERAIYFRFWMAEDTYQALSPVQSVIFISVVQSYLTEPHLGAIFLPCRNEDDWAPMLEYAMHDRSPELDFEVDGKGFGVFFKDWRVTPPKRWLQLLADREAPLRPAVSAPVQADVLVLSREQFSKGVADALRNLQSSTRLSDNPLLKSRLVLDRCLEGTETRQRVVALRQVVGEALAVMKENRRDLKLYRALDASFLRPRRSQEASAEAVDVSIATFRRHLKAGVDQLTQILWEIETDSMAVARRPARDSRTDEL